ncbi:hypothetical protein AB4Z55_26215 [Gordonia sp. ABKF26]|uniref:hypothetical protein n=1 Tax=Gordonia sp. ABKF26 TaxID=3238687 RepID=UPI0034E59678
MIVENMDDHAWVVPDDEVEPFDESMLIEFCYQVFATPDEVKDFAAGLCAAVTPVIDTVGRYQLGRVSLTSVENGQHDERHSASRRQRNPGQMLFDVTFAVRGRGDRNWLGHAIFHECSPGIDGDCVPSPRPRVLSAGLHHKHPPPAMTGVRRRRIGNRVHGRCTCSGPVKPCWRRCAGAAEAIAASLTASPAGPHS